MRHRSVRSGVFALAAAILFTASALAQTPAGADPDALFERGRELRAEHRDAEALVVFERLHAATGAARALAQTALAEGALGRWVAAEAHLAAALSGPSDAWTDANRDSLSAALSTVREHLGSLLVECETPGAEVAVADAAPVALPLAQPLRAVAGSAVIVVRAPEHPPLRRVVTVPVGGLARETFVLPEAPHPVAPPAVAPVVPVVRREPQRASRRPWAIGGAVAAGTLVAVGAVLYGVGLGEVAEYNTDPRCPGLDAVGVPPSECSDRVDSADRLLAASIGLWAGGAALAGLSVVLFASEPRARPSALTCGPGLGSVHCALRF